MIRILMTIILMICPFVVKSENMFDEVIRRIEEASDPQGRIKKCNSFYSSQRVVDDNESDIVVTTLFKAPDLYRVTTYSKGIPVRIKLIKKSGVWMFSLKTSDEGKLEISVNEVAGRDLAFALMQASLANPHVSLDETFSDIAVTTRVVDEVLYYKLTAIPKSKENGIVEIYADSKTFLKKAFLFKREKDGEVFDMKMEIKSYHDIGGALVPDVTQIESGESTHVLKLIEYKLNTDIKDSEFDTESIMTQLDALL